MLQTRPHRIEQNDDLLKNDFQSKIYESNFKEN